MIVKNDGGVIVMGIAENAGFFVASLGSDLGFGCKRETLRTQPGSPATTPLFNIGMIPFNPVLTSDDKNGYGELAYTDSTVCFTCNPIKTRLADTVLCSYDTLRIRLNEPGAKYVWSDGSTSATKAINTDGAYWVKITTWCDTFTDTFSVHFTQPYKPGITHNPLIPEPDVEMSFYGTPPGAFLSGWKLDDSSQDTGNFFQHTFHENGDYDVTYWVEDSLGCHYKTSVVIGILAIDYYFPNAFSPSDRDGLNKTWEPVGRGIKSYHLEVFNRWGQRMYKGESAGWNGSFNGKEVPEGLYFYQISLVDDANKRHHRSGYIMLLR
jgi:gliding motility-associated-like protein